MSSAEIYKQLLREQEKLKTSAYALRVIDLRSGDKIAQAVTEKTIASEQRKSAMCDPDYFVLCHGMIFSVFLAMKYLSNIHPIYQFTAGDSVLGVIKKFVTGRLYGKALSSYIEQRPDEYNCVSQSQRVNLYLCGYDPAGGDCLYPIMQELLIRFARSRPESDVAKKLALPFSLDLDKIVGELNFETIYQPLYDNPSYNYLGDLDFYRGLILLFPHKQDQLIEKITKTSKRHAISDMLYYLEDRGQLERFNRLLYADYKKPATVKKEPLESLADKQAAPEPPLKKARIK